MIPPISMLKIQELGLCYVITRPALGPPSRACPPQTPPLDPALTASKISALSCFGIALTLKVKVMISTKSKFLSKHRTKYDFVTVTFKVIQSKKVMVSNKREYKFISINNCNKYYYVSLLQCFIQRYLQFACSFVIMLSETKDYDAK